MYEESVVLIATIVARKKHAARGGETAVFSLEIGVVGATMSSKITKRMMSSVDDMVSRAASSATQGVSSALLLLVLAVFFTCDLSTHLHLAQPVSVLMPRGETSSHCETEMRISNTARRFRSWPCNA